MRRLALAVFLALAACQQRVDKCCGPGSILVLNGTGGLECVRTPERMQALLDLRAEVERLPRCEESSYLEQKLWEDVAGIIPHEACLEIFFDENSHLDFPVLIYCKPPLVQQTRMRNQYLSDVVDKVAPSPVEILNFRKCCPDGSYYSVDKKFCLDEEADFKLLFEHLRGVDFIDVYSGPPSCEHVLVDYKVALADVYYDAGDISMTIDREEGAKNITIDQNNACLDAEPSSDFIVARVCREADYCDTNPCIRKCCPENNNVNASCLDLASITDVGEFRTSLAFTASSSNVTPAFDTKRYGLLIGKPCNYMYSDLVDSDFYESWKIGNFGEIITSDYFIYNHANSCLEFVYNHSELDNGLHSFFCFEEDNDYYYISRVRAVIIAGLTLTSCFFLLAMLLVYICLPSLQNLHGKTIMCHAISLFLAYVCLAIVMIITSLQLLDHFDEYVADMICKYLGYTMIFCFHSTFLWLNVMCFDIWWTFGGLHGAASASSKKAQQRNRFLGYCAYAWGLGLLLTGLAAVPELLGLPSYSFGRQRCWFDYQSTAEIVFFMSPITITLIINTIFFIMTSRRCSKVKAEIKRMMTNVKNSKTRKFHSDKTRLIMNLKLFVVMGIPWLLENLTGYLNHYALLPVWAQGLVFGADVVNSLQGFWIFVLFVLKPRVYRALRRRFLAPERLADRGNCSGNRLAVQATGSARGLTLLGSSNSSSSTLNLRLSSSS